MEIVQSRFRVLSRHLVQDDDEEQQVSRSDVSAATRPLPGGGSGRLHVVDERTGKKYEIGINDDGAIRASDFKKVTGEPDDQFYYSNTKSRFHFIFAADNCRRGWQWLEAV